MSSRIRYKRRPLPYDGMMYIPQAASASEAAIVSGWTLKRRIVGKFPYYEIRYDGVSQCHDVCGLAAAKKELERLAAKKHEEESS